MQFHCGVGSSAETIYNNFLKNISIGSEYQKEDILIIIFSTVEGHDGFTKNLKLVSHPFFMYYFHLCEQAVFFLTLKYKRFFF